MRDRLQILALLTTLATAPACALGGPADEPNEPEPTVRSDTPSGPGPSNVGDQADPDEEREPTENNAITAVGCPVGSCEPGDTKCSGPHITTCEADSLNPECGIWGAPTSCVGAQEACVEGECIVPMGCVDADGDDHGVLCAAGDDCDDDDPTAYVGATDVCDGVDNNCDGAIDEGFQLGMACTYGGGTCQADGVIECGPDGGTICSGMAVGQPEVCDGADNDCNGIIDDGVCGPCQGDIFEPNDDMSTASLIQVDAPTWGYTCPQDVDWFELETQTGVTYHIYVTFPEDRSDLIVRGYVDGQQVIVGDTPGRDYEVFVVTGDANKSFHIEVEDRDNIESWFHVSLVADWNCTSEDGFVPNQTIVSAVPFPAEWITTAYMCNGYLSDWYYVGELSVGSPFYAGIVGDYFDTDLDLHFWGDPDGDGSFERMASAATFESIEEIDITVPHDGPFYIEVVDFDGWGGAYDIGWSNQ